MRHFLARISVLVFLSLIVSVVHHGIVTAQVQTQKIVLGEKHRIQSQLLGEERLLLVRLPRGYEESTQKYPVLYVLDGEFFFYQSVSAVQFLAERQYGQIHAIPELIIVGIVNVDRNRDFTPTHAPDQGPSGQYPTSGGAEPFLRFLERELIPFVDQQYRTQPYRILAGWSLGGLFTVHTLLEKPELFSAYLAISPSLWWDDQVVVKRADPLFSQGRVPARTLVVTLGSLEIGAGIGNSVRGTFLPLAKAKWKNAASLRPVELPGEGHSDVPIKAIYEGLKALYADWMLPGDAVQGGLASINSFYEELSKRYGYKVDVPESGYGQLAAFLAGQNRQEEAFNITKIWTQKYPTSSWARFILGIRQQRLGNLEEARACFVQALQMEKAGAEPDSERIVGYSIQLKAVESRLPAKP